MVDSTATDPGQKMVQRAIAVGIGNFMEWFDFAVYGFFAIIIGKLFFAQRLPRGRGALLAGGFRRRLLRPAARRVHPRADRRPLRPPDLAEHLGRRHGPGHRPDRLHPAVRQHRRRRTAAPGAVALRPGPLGGRRVDRFGLVPDGIRPEPPPRPATPASSPATAALATLVGSLFALLLNSTLSPADLARGAGGSRSGPRSPWP